MRLKGKNAIVTGSGAGIGRATAIRFAEEGARVMVAELDEASGRKTVETIRQAGGEAWFHRTDAADAASVDAMVDAASANIGPVNTLVNNAAAFVFGRIEEVSADDWAKVLGVNVVGYANTARAVLPHMREAGGGAIVNVASMSGFIAQPEFVPYNTSKGGVMQLTRCLAMDLADDRIRVNGVCPGPIYTQASERHMDFLGIDREEGRRLFGQDTLLKRMGRAGRDRERDPVPRLGRGLLHHRRPPRHRRRRHHRLTRVRAQTSRRCATPGQKKGRTSVARRPGVDTGPQRHPARAANRAYFACHQGIEGLAFAVPTTGRARFGDGMRSSPGRAGIEGTGPIRTGERRCALV